MLTSKIANVDRSVLKECVEGERKYLKIEDSPSVGQNKNDGKVSKTNKTGEDKIQE